MTDTHATPEGEQPKRETLYITDAELIRRIGVPENIAYRALHALDENRLSGFPRKQEFWGNRRYWPAVKAYLDTINGIKVEASGAARLIPESRAPHPVAAPPFPMRGTRGGAQ